MTLQSNGVPTTRAARWAGLDRSRPSTTCRESARDELLGRTSQGFSRICVRSPSRTRRLAIVGSGRCCDAPESQ